MPSRGLGSPGLTPLPRGLVSSHPHQDPFQAVQTPAWFPWVRMQNVRNPLPKPGRWALGRRGCFLACHPGSLGGEGRGEAQEAAGKAAAGGPRARRGSGFPGAPQLRSQWNHHLPRSQPVRSRFWHPPRWPPSQGLELSASPAKEASWPGAPPTPTPEVWARQGGERPAQISAHLIIFAPYFLPQSVLKWCLGVCLPAGLGGRVNDSALAGSSRFSGPHLPPLFGTVWRQEIY